MSEHTADAVEQVLREDLARGDAIIVSARPVLRHLLVNEDRGLFSDETIARVRGMIHHLAGELLFAQAAAADALDRPAYVSERQDALAEALFADTALLSHAHATTVEGQIAERIEARSGVDSVMPPLVQELAAAPEEAVAALAMSVLAAQARFQQHFRRMELPLRELPGELFHRALILARAHGGSEASAQAAERQLRGAYEEGTGRLGLLTRLVLGMGQTKVNALAIDHAGVAIFATALALASEQRRDSIVLSFGDRQSCRLALGLRAAGLAPQGVEKQLLYLHPEIALPVGFDALPAERAAALLGGSLPETAS